MLAPASASANTMPLPMPLLPPVTMATFPWRVILAVLRCCSRDAKRVRVGLREAVDEVLADPDRVGHGGERRVHRADAGEEARVDHVEVVELVRLAVGIEHGRRRIGAEA